MSLRIEPVPAASAFLERFRRVLESRPFHPHWLARGGHLQTLAASLSRRRFDWGYRESQTEMVDLPDGTRVRVVTVLQSPMAPTLVATHGMGGSSDSIYMQGLSHKAYREGWNAILLNLYDLSYKTRKPTIFHSGASRPVAGILRALIRKHRLERVFLAGVSMSGNILLKLLGEGLDGELERVRAAAAVSPLLDMTISWQILETLENSLYRVHFVRGLKNIMRQRAPYLARYVDLDALLRIKTIREFDDVFTAPLSGFRGALHYYEEASAVTRVPRISRPTLLLHAKDDPLLPWEPLTRGEVQGNPNVLVHLTNHGGHVGFVESDLSDIDRSWAENRVIDFFRLAGDL